MLRQLSRVSGVVLLFLLVVAPAGPAWAGHPFERDLLNELREWRVRPGGLTATATGSYLVDLNGQGISGWSSRYRCYDQAGALGEDLSPVWDYQAGSNDVLQITWDCDTGTLGQIATRWSGSIVERYVHPFGWVAPDDPDPDPEPCALLGCVVDFIAGIDDWVVGLFTPSDDTKAAFQTAQDDLGNRIPFALVAQPVDWFEEAVGEDGFCPEDPRPGGCIAAFSFRIPNVGTNQHTADGEWSGGSSVIGFGDQDSDARKLARTLRPVIGAMLYGAMALGLAMWAFKRYAPGGSGGDD